MLAYAVEHLGVENGTFFHFYSPKTSCQLFARIYSVVIVGHAKCGGADACLRAAQAPDFNPSVPGATIADEPVDSPLNQWLWPLTLLAHSLGLPGIDDESLATLVKENVKVQVENLAKTETITKAWGVGTHKKQKVFIHGWVYDLGTGRLRDLEISRGPM